MSVRAFLKLIGPQSWYVSKWWAKLWVFLWRRNLATYTNSGSSHSKFVSKLGTTDSYQRTYAKSLQSSRCALFCPNTRRDRQILICQRRNQGPEAWRQTQTCNISCRIERENSKSYSKCAPWLSPFSSSKPFVECRLCISEQEVSDQAQILIGILSEDRREFEIQRCHRDNRQPRFFGFSWKSLSFLTFSNPWFQHPNVHCFVDFDLDKNLCSTNFPSRCPKVRYFSCWWDIEGRIWNKRKLNWSRMLCRTADA